MYNSSISDVVMNEVVLAVRLVRCSVTICIPTIIAWISNIE